MKSSTFVSTLGQHSRVVVAVALLLACGSLAGVSAHVVRGLSFPAYATAFVSSPSAGTDPLVRLVWGTEDTGLRVVCFYGANSSPSLPGQPDWPRVTGIGFELPGAPTGFTLVSPRDAGWSLIEGAALPVAGQGIVGLDFAIIAPAVAGSSALRGLPPLQPAVRGSGTRFCVSGPFPDSINGAAATIETLLNGVLVAFEGGPATGSATDLGVWIDPRRVIPLYP